MPKVFPDVPPPDVKLELFAETDLCGLDGREVNVHVAVGRQCPYQNPNFDP